MQDETIRTARVTGWVVQCPSCGEAVPYDYDPSGMTIRCGCCADPIRVPLICRNLIDCDNDPVDSDGLYFAGTT